MTAPVVAVAGRKPMVPCPTGKCPHQHDPAKCTGHLSTKRGPDGELLPCNRSPSAGHRVCMKHGAKSPQAEREARRRLIEEGAAKVLAEVEYGPVEDPVAVLADLAGQARAWMEHFAVKVDALGDGMRYCSEKEIEQLRAEVALFERMMDRTGRFVTDLAKLGFEERRVALEEDTARRLADVLMLVLDEVFSMLEGRKVTGALLVKIRNDEVPSLVAQAIETTGRAA